MWVIQRHEWGSGRSVGELLLHKDGQQVVLRRPIVTKHPKEHSPSAPSGEKEIMSIRMHSDVSEFMWENTGNWEEPELMPCRCLLAAAQTTAGIWGRTNHHEKRKSNLIFKALQGWVKASITLLYSSRAVCFLKAKYKLDLKYLL